MSDFSSSDDESKTKSNKKKEKGKEIMNKKEKKEKEKIVKFNEKILETLAKPKKLEIQQIKFSFTPEINKNSQEIWEKRNRILEENLKSEEKNDWFLGDYSVQWYNDP